MSTIAKDEVYVYGVYDNVVGCYEFVFLSSSDAVAKRHFGSLMDLEQYASDKMLYRLGRFDLVSGLLVSVPVLLIDRGDVNDVEHTV